jgi:hypothetical protein
MKNEGLLIGLRIAGALAYVVGGLVFFLLLAQFGKGGMFGGRGEITGSEFLIAVGVFFYHAIFGILCFGVAQALQEATKAAGTETARENQNPGETKCSKCGQTYDGDLRGQFCESCGEKL